MTTLRRHPPAQRGPRRCLVRSSPQRADNWKRARKYLGIAISQSASKFSQVRRAALCGAVFPVRPCLAERRRVRLNTAPYPNSLRHSQHSLSSLRGSRDTNDFRSSLAPDPFADAHTGAPLVDSCSHCSQKTPPKKQALTMNETGGAR